jgi:Ni/Co efflux regulator RcnB
MKRLLFTAAALALVSAPAFAQQQQDQWQGRHGDQRQGRQTQAQPQAQPQGQAQSHPGMRYDQSSGWIPQTQGAARAPTTRAGVQQPGGRPDWNAYYRNNPDLQRAYRQNQQSPTYHESIDAFAQRHYQEHGRAEGRNLPTVQGVQPQDRGRGGGNQDQYRRQDRAHDWRSYQRNTFSQRHYRGPEFRWPRGFSYRRYTFGEFLPQIFFGENYWLYDYSDYGLPYPPPGTAWVRYGPDALLIDRYTGEIVQVIYGVFY